MYDPTIDWKLAFMIEPLQIAAGDVHSLFLNSRGNVFGIGINRYGQLGDGSTNDTETPVKMDTSKIKEPIVQIAAGGSHSLLLDSQGNVFGAGSNRYGQLGDGSTNDTKTPVKMDTSKIKNQIVQIVAGGSHSLLLVNKGNVFGTGLNYNGQLGDGSTNDTKTPVKMDTSKIKEPIVQIAAGGVHSLLLDNKGNVFGTGLNSYGQLGDVSTNEAKTPVKMDTSKIKNRIVQIAGGYFHSLLLDNKGNVFGTGINNCGQLGNVSIMNQTKIPVKMDTSKIKDKIVQIAAGSYHSLLLDNQGNVFGTGLNSYGQLGNGSTNEAKIPVKMDTSNIKNQIVQIAAGDFHSLLLDNRGNVFYTGHLVIQYVPRFKIPTFILNLLKL